MTAPLAVRRFRLVAIVLPAVLIALAVLVQLLVLPALPDPVAIHWGASGEPDGFWPAWIGIAVTAVVGFGIPVLIAASVLGALRHGDRGASYRLLGATALGIAALMGVLGTATFAMQAGVTDAADGPAVWWPLVGAFAAALVAGVGGWLLQPDEPYRPTVLPAGGSMDLRDTERAVWLQSVRLARGGAVVLGIALAVLIASAIVTLIASPDPVVAWILGVVTIVLVALIATTAAFHVRVDEDGLRVISAVGAPRVHIPLDEIEAVEAVEVNPMGEFGGWGLRWAPGGGSGVVLRTGPGIRVTRTTGKAFTVTVDDAATGAALLEALRTRTR